MYLDFTSIAVMLGIPSAVTGLCFWAVKRSIAKRDAERDERDKAREKNEILLIRASGAAIALGEATALAIQEGKCNGKMEKALEYAQTIKHEQKDFMVEQGIKNLFCD